MENHPMTGKQITLEQWDNADTQTRFAFLQNHDYLNKEDTDKLEARIKSDMVAYFSITNKEGFWE